MKTAVFVMLLLGASAGAKPLQFVEDDFAAAISKAKQRKVPLVVDTWAAWCHTCVFMREHVLNRPELGGLSKQFVFAAIDTEKPTAAAFLEKYPVDIWPTLFVIDPNDGRTILRWHGAATVEQLKSLLGETAASVKQGGGNSGKNTDVLLARADRLLAAGEAAAAIAAYDDAWSQRVPGKGNPRAIEGKLDLLSQADEYQRCAEEGLRDLKDVPPGPAFASVVELALDCAVSGEPEQPWRAPAIDGLIPFAEKAAAMDGLLSDVRSSVYLVLVSAYRARGRTADVRPAGESWLQLLEEAIAASNTAEARTVFDAHVVPAAVAAGRIDRALELLKASEAALPNDYNAPARLAGAYREMGRYDDALSSIDRALGKVAGPRRVRLLETKAGILDKMGNVAAKKDTLEHALAFAATLPPSQRPKRAVAAVTAELAKTIGATSK